MRKDIFYKIEKVLHLNKKVVQGFVTLRHEFCNCPTLIFLNQHHFWDRVVKTKIQKL
jgi:hypothetical protein